MVRLALAGGGVATMLGGVIALAAHHHTGEFRPPVVPAAAPPALRITSTLPAWRAPGVRVTVSGWAGANERVRLLSGARSLASGVAGRRGRFHLRFRTGAPDTYRLRVQGRARWIGAGRLLVRPAVLEAVGDITFGEQVGPAVEEYGARYPWTGVARALRAADVTTGNLEGVISTRGAAAVKQYTFRGPPQALAGVAAAGFDVLTLANNHSVDYGRDALLDTIRLAHAWDIRTIGAGANETQARRRAAVETGGLRIAFLGYSDVNPLGFNASAASAGTADADAEAIVRDVRAARRHADVVVCFFHWGTELRAEPDARQEEFARDCLGAGAQVVLGAHPHVFGAVERPSRSTLVAWTLGNFVFPSSGAPAHSGILRVQLDAHGVRGYRVRPVTIEGFRPRLDKGLPATAP